MGRLTGNGDSNSLDTLCGGSRCVSFGAASAYASLSTAHNHRQTTNWNSWLTHSVATNSNDNTNSFLHCNHINSRSISSSSSSRLLLQQTANSNQQPTADCRFETSQQQTANSQQPTADQPTANSQQPTVNSRQAKPTANIQQPTANSQQPTAKSFFC
jgi:hypothetical protein